MGTRNVRPAVALLELSEAIEKVFTLRNMQYSIAQSNPAEGNFRSFKHATIQTFTHSSKLLTDSIFFSVLVTQSLGEIGGLSFLHVLHRRGPYNLEEWQLQQLPLLAMYSNRRRSFDHQTSDG